MTRLHTPPTIGQNKKQVTPSIWVRTHLEEEGSDKYHLSILEKKRHTRASHTEGCAFAKLILMESGAIMASFPVMGMVSGTIRSMLGAAWFELATPFEMPAALFGHEIEIPAGRYPLVFVLESWVVLFRPNEQPLQ